MWTNKIGQEINIGDRVVAVGTSKSRVGVYQGEFVGLSKSNNPQVRVLVKNVHTGYVFKATGLPALSTWNYMRQNRIDVPYSWLYDSEYRKVSDAYASTIISTYGDRHYIGKGLIRN